MKTIVIFWYSTGASVETQNLKSYMINNKYCNSILNLAINPRLNRIRVLLMMLYMRLGEAR